LAERTRATNSDRLMQLNARYLAVVVSVGGAGGGWRCAGGGGEGRTSPRGSCYCCRRWAKTRRRRRCGRRSCDKCGGARFGRWRWGAPPRREPAVPAPTPLDPEVEEEELEAAHHEGGCRGPQRRRQSAAATGERHSNVQAAAATGSILSLSSRGNQRPPGCGRWLRVVAGDVFVLQHLFLLFLFFIADADAECRWRPSQSLD
jgi:hypothetical protein